eukprot:m.169600 g.169600  ORF g.169600 m.169600 type:complete len:71 (+) comp25121_c0_seq2:778-990(+)
MMPTPTLPIKQAVTLQGPMLFQPCVPHADKFPAGDAWSMSQETIDALCTVLSQALSKCLIATLGSVDQCG